MHNDRQSFLWIKQHERLVEPRTGQGSLDRASPGNTTLVESPLRHLVNEICKICDVSGTDRRIANGEFNNGSGEYEGCPVTVPFCL
jgi:hypothetical protein